MNIFNIWCYNLINGKWSFGNLHNTRNYIRLEVLLTVASSHHHTHHQLFRLNYVQVMYSKHTCILHDTMVFWCFCLSVWQEVVLLFLTKFDLAASLFLLSMQSDTETQKHFPSYHQGEKKCHTLSPSTEDGSRHSPTGGSPPNQIHHLFI